MVYVELLTTGSEVICLSDRSQFVEVENTKFTKLPIECGVPQGSILEPLLYLIYVNDISHLGKANILSFADETTL